jgi:hypothetical protein
VHALDALEAVSIRYNKIIITTIKVAIIKEGRNVIIVIDFNTRTQTLLGYRRHNNA